MAGEGQMTNGEDTTPIYRLIIIIMHPSENVPRSLGACEWNASCFFRPTYPCTYSVGSEVRCVSAPAQPVVVKRPLFHAPPRRGI